MPVLIDPVIFSDVLIQGEQLRSLALQSNVILGSPVILMASVVSSVVMPGTDPNTLGMMGNDGGQPGAVTDLMISANAGIATTCGAWIPLPPRVVLQDAPTSTQQWIVTGVTRSRDTNAPVGGCRVVVIASGAMAVTGTPVVGETVSDGSGNYSTPVPLNQHYQVIAYKPGSPDIAGITRADVVPDPNG